LLAIYPTEEGREEMAASHAKNENLRRLLLLTREMLALADEGDRDRQDASCGILYGILRDAGYQLRKLTLAEQEKHEKAGTWD
jgi:hypothetical protein